MSKVSVTNPGTVACLHLSMPLMYSTLRGSMPIFPFSRFVHYLDTLMKHLLAQFHHPFSVLGFRPFQPRFIVVSTNRSCEGAEQTQTPLSASAEKAPLLREPPPCNRAAEAALHPRLRALKVCPRVSLCKYRYSQWREVRCYSLFKDVSRETRVWERVPAPRRELCPALSWPRTRRGVAARHKICRSRGRDLGQTLSQVGGSGDP